MTSRPRARPARRPTARSAAPPLPRRSPLAGPEKFLPILVICAGLYAYHNSLGGPFIFDDLPTIRNNTTIRQLWPPWAILSPPRGIYGRPVVNLSLALNYAWGGLNVWGYHVFNVTVHIAAALLLYGIVRRTLLRPGLREQYGSAAPWLALSVALIWVVHPLQTESVTYLITRTESMMGLFFFLTLYCVVRGVESPRPGAWYAAATGSTVLGMGCKEVIAVAPVIVLAYDRLFLSTSFRETFRRRGGLYAGLAATWIVFALLVRARVHMDVTRLETTDVTRWDYLKTQAGVIVHYLRLSFWPTALVADYDDWPLARSLVPMLPWAAVVLTLLGATLWALHRWRPVAFLGMWFFLILAPTSSIWPQLSEFAAERRMYLPLAAVIVLVVLGGYAVLGRIEGRLGWPSARRRLVEAVVVGAVVVALAQGTVRRNEDYRTALSFWSDVVQKRPGNARGHNNLGNTLGAQGRAGESLVHYTKALSINPNYADAHYNVGLLVAGQGKVEEAIAHYTEALRSNPKYLEAHNNLANALAAQGKPEEAIAHYTEALRINPEYVEAHYNLGLALASQGKLEEAMAHYAEALRIDPRHIQAHNNVGIALASRGKVEEAIGHYNEALRINPRHASAHYNLGVALAGQGKWKDAIAHYSEAARIAPSALRYYQLAMALSRDGRSQDAMRHLEAALKLDPGYEPARRALQDLTAR